jgi:hypothetical protein
MRILLVFFAVSLLIEVIVDLLALYKINNLWLFHISTLLEYTLLILVFSYWQKKDILKLSLRLSIPLFLLIWFAAKLFLESFNQFDNFTSSMAGVILVVVSSYTLYDLSKENSVSLSRDPRFWVGSAVLIYYTGNLMLFALSNIITIWAIHSILNIIANLIYSGGFLCLRRR